VTGDHGEHLLVIGSKVHAERRHAAARARGAALATKAERSLPCQASPPPPDLGHGFARGGQVGGHGVADHLTPPVHNRHRSAEPPDVGCPPPDS